ncbi:MAG: STAS domain-containing protein, partial [Flavobacteriales bacterium]|nr:STAS domain-containing protein [Flavobacteriales bacterium]
RMGFLVNFLSQPVISGFTSAAALIIAVSQLKYLLGLDMISSTGFVETITGIIQHLDSTDLYALAIGGGGLLLILLLKKIKASLPGALIAVIISILIVKFAWSGESSLATVGEIPAGLPGFSMPTFSIEAIMQVLPLALVICLISFIESLAIAKTLATKHEQFGIDANKELLGLGLAKFIGSFFQAFPNTGSFTRSAINEQAGARTGLASIFGALIVGLTLLFFTGAFYHLPQAILAAIVISAVFGLIDYKGAYQLFKTHKKDFTVFILTFILTLLLGIQKGVLVGVILSLLFILQKVSRPHHAVLGKIKKHDVYRNVERFEEAEEADDLLIARYDDDIFFGNAEHFYKTILEVVKSKPNVKDFILDMNAVGQIDTTGIIQFELLVKTIESMGIRVHLCSIKGPVRDEFKNYKLGKMLHGNRIHWDIDNAIDRIEESRLKNGMIKT